MRDPNSEMFQKWQRLAATGEMTGRNRPVTRIGLSKQGLKSVDSNRPGPWRYLLFQDGEEEFGLVKSVQINRSLGDDSASCTIVIYNDYMQHYAYSPQGIDTGIGRPGYMTFNRGDNTPIKTQSVYNQFVGGEDSVTQFQDFEYDNEGNPSDPAATAALRAKAAKELFPTSWGYPYASAPPKPSPGGVGVSGPGQSSRPTRGPERTERFKYYYDRLIPNRLIRTYQGYGSDNFDVNGNWKSTESNEYVFPGDDTQLVVTGHWLVDQVVYTSDGLITITCRDVGKVMLEQVVYPPLIPLSRFPLVYCPETPPSGERGSISQDMARGYEASSNDPYFGRNAKVYGHRPSDAFDSHNDTYWLSVGNLLPNGPYSYEWIQTPTNGATINEVMVRMKGTGYTCFVSVMEGGVWQGDKTVPYDPDDPASFPNGANIKYVLRTTLGNENDTFISLPRAYNAQRVRVCFTNLWNSNLGDFKRRAAVREFRVRFNKPDTYNAGTIGQPMYINDWSEAVKELCAWSGFTWLTDTNVYDGSPNLTALDPDPLLGTAGSEPLKVWGDFERLGAGPVECTPSDFFLNKSFRECINTIRDFLGCIFFIDESGGATFRFPNLFSGGNFIFDPPTGSARQAPGEARTAPPYLKRTWPIEFHENANLLSYSVTINDAQVRSEVLVVGTNPDTNSTSPLAAGVVLGRNSVTGDTSAVNFTNVLAGQYRLFLVPGSQTAGFKTLEECQRMAELIGLKILQSYRKGQAQILGHPGLQLDDQVRIFERITNEYNVHYVSGISSSMDMETGEYLMDVTTHWLGDDPDNDWFLKNVQLTPAVKNLPAIIARIGEASRTVPGPGGQTSDPATGNKAGT